MTSPPRSSPGYAEAQALQQQQLITDLLQSQASLLKERQRFMEKELQLKEKEAERQRKKVTKLKEQLRAQATTQQALETPSLEQPSSSQDVVRRRRFQALTERRRTRRVARPRRCPGSAAEVR